MIIMRFFLVVIYIFFFLNAKAQFLPERERVCVGYYENSEDKKQFPTTHKYNYIHFLGERNFDTVIIYINNRLVFKDCIPIKSNLIDEFLFEYSFSRDRNRHQQIIKICVIAIEGSKVFFETAYDDRYRVLKLRRITDDFGEGEWIANYSNNMFYMSDYY